MIKLWEKMDDCWTIYEHLARKTADGKCGLDILMDNGIEYISSPGIRGDIEVSMYGRTGYNGCTINYILEAPLVCPWAYDDLYKKNKYLATFTALKPEESYVKSVCGHWNPRSFKSQVCGIFDYETDWKNKDKFMILLTSIQNFHNKYTNKYGICHQRFDFVKMAAERYGDRFDFYSRKAPKDCPNHRGGLADHRRWDYIKMDYMSKYKFAICLENSQFNGYVTEKISHALNCRCIPIYYGAPDINEYLDPELFINVSDFPTFSHCLEYVDSLSDAQIKEKIDNINTFVNDSKKTYMLSSLRLADDFVKAIKE